MDKVDMALDDIIRLDKANKKKQRGGATRGRGSGNRGRGSGNRGRVSGNRVGGIGNRGRGTGYRGRGIGNRGRGIARGRGASGRQTFGDARTGGGAYRGATAVRMGVVNRALKAVQKAKQQLQSTMVQRQQDARETIINNRRGINITTEGLSTSQRRPRRERVLAVRGMRNNRRSPGRRARGGTSISRTIGAVYSHGRLAMDQEAHKVTLRTIERQPSRGSGYQRRSRGFFQGGRRGGRGFFNRGGGNTSVQLVRVDVPNQQFRRRGRGANNRPARDLESDYLAQARALIRAQQEVRQPRGRRGNYY